MQQEEEQGTAGVEFMAAPDHGSCEKSDPGND
jgi:hypothetical protein